MPLSNSIYSYEDIRAILDRALESDKGIRVSQPSHGAAVHLRHRIYKFRILDRQASKKIFPDETDLRHGTSIYDSIIAEVVDTSVIVRKTNVDRILEMIEEIE